MTNRTFKAGASREQGTLLLPRVEEYVGLDNPVRAIESYVAILDLGRLGFRHAVRGVELVSLPMTRATSCGCICTAISTRFARRVVSSGKLYAIWK